MFQCFISKFFKLFQADKRREKRSLKNLTIKEALGKLEKGVLKPEDIINFQKGRAKGLVILKDILQNPHIILKDLGKKNRR